VSRRSSTRFWVFIILAIAILSIFPLYTRFKTMAAPIPPGVQLAGVDLSHLKDPEDIRGQLAPPLTEPLGVRFRDRILVLRPEEVDFRPDVEATIAAATRYLNGPEFVDIALREAIGLPQQVRNVPLYFTVDEAKVRAWLEEQARQMDYAPIPARARAIDLAPDAPETADATPTAESSAAADSTTLDVITEDRTGPDVDWAWMAGEPGFRIDVEGSIPRVVAGLASTRERMVDLSLIVTPPPTANLDDLAGALELFLSSFPGIGAFYVEELATGATAQVNSEVAFSGMSTLKIALVTALMDTLPVGVSGDEPRTRQLGELADRALGESNNYAANLLIDALGDGDRGAGLRRFNTFVRELGLTNTYMQSGYDAAAQLAVLPTAANQRTDIQTEPDNNIQTTAADLGRMLAALYHCSQGEGLLLERRPTTLTPDECRTVLFYMTHDEFREMVWGGLPTPDDQWILHKHGFSAWHHSDAALIWGPTGPYVVTMFLYRPGWLDWATSNAAFKEASRLIWRFFEFRREQGQPAAGEPLVLTPPPVYVKIVEYAPSAANPRGE
jgi:beta-lactamase class A